MTNGMLFIIRGLPGAGKTTLANELKGIVCEADQFFWLDGEYKYDASKIADAHKFCQDEVKDTMLMGASTICVSNTFSQRWEMEVYYALAQIYNYDVTEITLTGKLHGSLHNVPEEKIQQMKDRWER